MKIEKRKYLLARICECANDYDIIYAKSDLGAKRIAAKKWKPYQSNWTWYGYIRLYDIDGIKITKEVREDDGGEYTVYVSDGGYEAETRCELYEELGSLVGTYGIDGYARWEEED